MLVLARKYRPRSLKEVIGQPSVVQTLYNALVSNRLHHAYLFYGKFGTGKTSCARILAAAENCKTGKDCIPCGSCSMCKAVFAGEHSDIVEIDAASGAGKVDQIRELKNTANYSPIDGATTKYFIIDECLGRNSRVETEEGLIHIGKIVNNKMRLKVKSYNEVTEEIEYKPITNWFKNPPKIVYKIGFETSGRLYACDNHRVCTPEGEKLVADLSEGDEVLRKAILLSPLQEQLIYGSLLGDMSIAKNESIGRKRSIETAARLKVSHSSKQAKYVDHKYEVLRAFVVTAPKTAENGGYGEEVRRFTTQTEPAFVEVWNTVIQNRHKKVTTDWLNKLDWTGVAYWFCDDGSCAHHKCKNGSDSYYITFATHGFDLSEQKTIQIWFANKGIDVSIKTDSRGRGYYLHLNNANSLRLLSYICWFVPDSMSYKLHGFTDKIMTEHLPSAKLSNENKEGLIRQRVVLKEVSGEEPFTYDIEVEDNHNYFVSGTLVHNCHRMTPQAEEALLKLLEEPPENVRFILCTTELPQMRGTIRSRCQLHEFKKIYWREMVQHLENVAKSENVDCPRDALILSSKLADGSMRNALQNLEKLIDFAGSDKITTEIAQKAFGTASDMVFFDLIDSAIGEGKQPDATEGYRIINNLLASGMGFDTIFDGVSETLRNILIAVSSTDCKDLIAVSEEGKKRLVDQAQRCRSNLRAVLNSLRGLVDMKISVDHGLSPDIALQTWFLDSVMLFHTK